MRPKPRQGGLPPGVSKGQPSSALQKATRGAEVHFVQQRALQKEEGIHPRPGKILWMSCQQMLHHR